MSPFSPHFEAQFGVKTELPLQSLPSSSVSVEVSSPLWEAKHAKELRWIPSDDSYTHLRRKIRGGGGHHCVFIVVLLLATATLPAEALLWTCAKQGATLYFFLLCWRYTPREPRRTQTCPHVGFLMFSEPPVLCLLSPCCGHAITAATMACVAVALCVRMLCFRHAQTHFFVCLYSRAFLGNQYSACGCIALDVFCLRKHCFGRVQNRGATLSLIFLFALHP